MLRVDRLLFTLVRAIACGTGPATILPSGINSILRSRAGLDAPDIQIIFGAGALEARPWLPGFNDWEDVFYLRPVGSHPKSRGYVQLASPDPREAPRIDPRYLSDPDDIRVLREGFRIVRDVVRQAALDPYRGKELSPAPDANPTTRSTHTSA